MVSWEGLFLTLVYPPVPMMAKAAKAKAAQIIRKDLLRHEQQFNGDISKERQFEGISSCIFQLISLIIEMWLRPGLYSKIPRKDYSKSIPTSYVQYCKEET